MNENEAQRNVQLEDMRRQASLKSHKWNYKHKLYLHFRHNGYLPLPIQEKSFPKFPITVMASVIFSSNTFSVVENVKSGWGWISGVIAPFPYTPFSYANFVHSFIVSTPHCRLPATLKNWDDRFWTRISQWCHSHSCFIGHLITLYSRVTWDPYDSSLVSFGCQGIQGFAAFYFSILPAFYISKSL